MYKESKIEEYILNHSEKEDPVLYKLYRETNTKMINPRMASGHIQGIILTMISKMIRPSRILEIGTFTGYSAICLAKGLNENGKLITIEKNDELIPFATSFFKESKLDDKIEMIAGKALDIIPTLSGNFDLAFIDGDKKEYIEYYESIFPLIKHGGFILVDNVLWNNKVIEPIFDEDKETKAIVNFNKKISSDNRIEKVILPLRDGIFLLRKK